MRRIFIFGLGYTAKRIGAALEARGWEVVSTGREGTLRFDDAGNVRLALADAGHVLSSVPPDGAGSDPVLEVYGDALGGKVPVYLSSTGIYGDTAGAWVDESAPTGQGRRTARAAADALWLDLGARVLRLPPSRRMALAGTPNVSIATRFPRTTRANSRKSLVLPPVQEPT